ncbi:MAG: zinc-binding dehydrogenase [Gammaproteobacteria bacterium]|nr:zinc-binding dehydrogenase [Gammaproteobacteria bacterium]
MMKETRKIVIQEIGKSFRECTAIVSETLGPPGPDEVLIRNHFAGVNGVYDQMMCLDRVEHTKVIPPADTGVEAVGVIETRGADVAEFAPGDTVATMNVGTAYRDWQVCKSADVISIPAATPEVLALIPSGVSALVALEQVAGMTTGETVCVTAACGGLGNVLSQLAVNAGNHVIGVCGSDEKAAWLESIGVARVIQYRREDAAAILAGEYCDKLDLVMDSVGGPLFDALVENLAPLGRLVVCGYTSDRVPTEKVRQERIYSKLYWKAASIRGYMNYRFAAHAADARERLLAMLAAGEIKPLVDGRQFVGLEAIGDAVEHLLNGENIGKVVVDLR